MKLNIEVKKRKQFLNKERFKSKYTDLDNSENRCLGMDNLPSDNTPSGAECFFSILDLEY